MARNVREREVRGIIALHLRQALRRLPWSLTPTDSASGSITALAVQMEPGRDRALTGAPGCERDTEGLQSDPILGRARRYDAVVVGHARLAASR